MVEFDGKCCLMVSNLIFVARDQITVNGRKEEKFATKSVD